MPSANMTSVSEIREMNMMTMIDMSQECDRQAHDTRQSVSFVDGMCSCCPYGYHIDLGFLNFCQSAFHDSALSSLKQIQRNKRILRKSMELMLNEQQEESVSSCPHLSASSESTFSLKASRSMEASNLLNMIQCEQVASYDVLEEIDHSVNTALLHSRRVQLPEDNCYCSLSAVSVNGRPDSLISTHLTSTHEAVNPQFTNHCLPSNPQRQQEGNIDLLNNCESNVDGAPSHVAGFGGSLSSLSSVSTLSSEKYKTYASGMFIGQPQEHVTAQIQQPASSESSPHNTADILAATMSANFPANIHQDLEDMLDTPLLPNTVIGNTSLAAIRKSMAQSLKRLRDLENQVKAIPILQVRISVLKEEKQLLSLQLKSKSPAADRPATVRSIGVGDLSVTLSDELKGGMISPVIHPFPLESTANVQCVPSTLSSPGTSLRKATRVKSIGVCDRSVMSTYLLQPHLPTFSMSGHNQTVGQLGLSQARKDEWTEERSVSGEAFEGPRPDQISPFAVISTANGVKHALSHTPTRSIGVGDSNVFDSSLQVHEKESRTVILDSSSSSAGKRNVGVQVWVPTRTVGVAYSRGDDRPSTRTVGVNVTVDTSDVVTTLDFKGEMELKQALRKALQRSVRSVATGCSFSPVTASVAVQCEGVDRASVGCGGDDCQVDVTVRQPGTQHNVGVLARVDVVSRTCCTDRGWILDRGSNTVPVERYDQGCMTPCQQFSSAATSTEVMLRDGVSQTDILMFSYLGMTRNAGVNTPAIATNNNSTCTDSMSILRRIANTSYVDFASNKLDLEVKSDDTVMVSKNQFQEVAVNTTVSPTVPNLEVCQLESVDIDGECACSSPSNYRTMEQKIIERGEGQAIAFLGCTSSSTSSSSIGQNDQSFFAVKCDLGEGSEGCSFSTSMSDCSYVSTAGAKINGVKISSLCNKTHKLSSIDRLSVGSVSDVVMHKVPTNSKFQESCSHAGSITAAVHVVEGKSYKERFGYIPSCGSSVTSVQFDRSSIVCETCCDSGKCDDCDALIQTSSETSLHTVRSPNSSDVCECLTDRWSSTETQKSSVETLVTDCPVVELNANYQSMNAINADYNDDSQCFSKCKSGQSTGVYSGKRTGSVEDFMPAELRKLMNLDGGSTTGVCNAAQHKDDDHLGTGINRSGLMHGAYCAESNIASMSKNVPIQGSNRMTTAGIDVKEECNFLSTNNPMDKINADVSETCSDGNIDMEMTSTHVLASECSASFMDSGFSESLAVGQLETQMEVCTNLCIIKSLEQCRLKSILKTSNTADSSFKEITFAENVVGGIASSSDEDLTDIEDGSSSSFEEGSYDSKEGKVVYVCSDHDTVSQKLYAAKIHDQNIRETYELSEELREASCFLADFLVDSTTIQTKDLNTRQTVVQEEWFRLSSFKLSAPHQVEDLLSSIKEISTRLLQYIVNLVDRNGNAAIHYCVSHGNYDILNLLLDTEICDVKQPNKAGYTPIMLTSLCHVQNEDHRDAIQRLLASGDVNSRAEQTGQTALMLASGQCRLDMTKLLLEQGADCNVQDFDGSTALMCACEHGYSDIALAILAQPGCDASLSDNEKSTAFSIAMTAGHKDLGVILYKNLNFSSNSPPKKKGSSFPIPRHSP